MLSGSHKRKFSISGRFQPSYLQTEKDRVLESCSETDLQTLLYKSHPLSIQFEVT